MAVQVGLPAGSGTVCLSGGGRGPSQCHGDEWVSGTVIQPSIQSLGVERPRQGQHYLSESQRGQGLQGNMKAQVSQPAGKRDTTITVEAGRGTALGMRPASDSLIKLPFPNVLKGEGEELEASPSVEFILELHPGTEKSKAVISQGK